MAAPYRHRKLLDNLTPPNATALFPYCFIDCNPELNPAAVCSADCTLYCPNFCRPFEPTSPSPTPSPAISPHAIPSPPDHHNLPISLKISLVFLIATFLYTVYKFYTVWCRSGTSPAPAPSPVPENQEFGDEDVVDHPIWYIRTVGLPASVINALTVVNYKIDGGGVEGSDCTVCLTEFEEDDTLRVLPNCKHAFHVRCIDTWLRSHTNCPLCRAVIVDNIINNNNINNINIGDTTSLEQNGAFEINLGSPNGDPGEASGSSGLRIGETDEDK